MDSGIGIRGEKKVVTKYTSHIIGTLSRQRYFNRPRFAIYIRFEEDKIVFRHNENRSFGSNPWHLLELEFL